jgi:hypothetical protein
MPEAHTEVGRYKFKVKEYADGTPWIAAEPLGRGLPIAEIAIIGFDVPGNTSLKKTREIAAYLNQNLANVKITLFI